MVVLWEEVMLHPANSRTRFHWEMLSTAIFVELPLSTHVGCWPLLTVLSILVLQMSKWSLEVTCWTQEVPHTIVHKSNGTQATTATLWWMMSPFYKPLQILLLTHLLRQCHWLTVMCKVVVWSYLDGDSYQVVETFQITCNTCTQMLWLVMIADDELASMPILSAPLYRTTEAFASETQVAHWLLQEKVKLVSTLSSLELVEMGIQMASAASIITDHGSSTILTNFEKFFWCA